MIPFGYMYKKIVLKPEWLKSQEVTDIYSLNGCISQNFADYLNYWKHNGYWLFDTPEVIELLAHSEGIDLGEMKLFYYEVFEEAYNADSQQWSLFAPEASFSTNVQIPMRKQLEGFDVTTFFKTMLLIRSNFRLTIYN